MSGTRLEKRDLILESATESETKWRFAEMLRFVPHEEAKGRKFLKSRKKPHEAKRFETSYLELFSDIHFCVRNSSFPINFLIFLLKKCDMRHVLLSVRPQLTCSSYLFFKIDHVPCGVRARLCINYIWIRMNTILFSS